MAKTDSLTTENRLAYKTSQVSMGVNDRKRTKIEVASGSSRYFLISVPCRTQSPLLWTPYRSEGEGRHLLQVGRKTLEEYLGSYLRSAAKIFHYLHSLVAFDHISAHDRFELCVQPLASSRPRIIADDHLAGLLASSYYEESDPCKHQAWGLVRFHERECDSHRRMPVPTECCNY